MENITLVPQGKGMNELIFFYFEPSLCQDMILSRVYKPDKCWEMKREGRVGEYRRTSLTESDGQLLRTGCQHGAGFWNLLLQRSLFSVDMILITSTHPWRTYQSNKNIDKLEELCSGLFIKIKSVEKKTGRPVVFFY